MQIRFTLIFIAALFASFYAKAATIAFEHGRWFDGRAFVETTFYSADGTLTQSRPKKIDRRVNLRGKFVVPAFGDAHHHGIDGIAGLDAKIASFRDAGVFYVKNPNVIGDMLTPELRAKINRPDSVDVVFSNGGLTASGGHPVKMHDMLAKRGVFAGMGPENMDNHAYFVIDSEADLDAKWPRIVKGKPDFIKTYLLYSEEWEKRRQGNAPRGLEPAMLARIVERAHAAGLRVSTHVETAADFRNAVLAGVDEITHLPHMGLARSNELEPFLIDEATARLAAQKKIVTVATLRSPSDPGAAMMMGPGGKPAPNDEAFKVRMQARADAENELNRRNLQTLAAAGVSIALGSDGISGEQPFVTSKGAAEYLNAFHIFDLPTIMRMWSENTAATIFPNRKVGRLAPGYEADFLVLDGDPVADFGNVSKIALRVRHGETMNGSASR